MTPAYDGPSTTAANEDTALAAELTGTFEEPIEAATLDPSPAPAPAPAAAPNSLASNEVGSYVNGSTFFKGLIKSSRSVGIDGKFEGEIQSEADVVIGRDAEVRGNIKAETVIISGRLVGNVNAQLLEIQATARVIGNLTAGQLLIAMGAVFRGQSFMGAQEEGEEMPEPLPDQTHGRSNRKTPA